MLESPQLSRSVENDPLPPELAEVRKLIELLPSNIKEWIKLYEPIPTVRSTAYYLLREKNPLLNRPNGNPIFENQVLLEHFDLWSKLGNRTIDSAIRKIGTSGDVEQLQNTTNYFCDSVQRVFFPENTSISELNIRSTKLNTDIEHILSYIKNLSTNTVNKYIIISVIRLLETHLDSILLQYKTHLTTHQDIVKKTIESAVNSLAPGISELLLASLSNSKKLTPESIAHIFEKKGDSNFAYILKLKSVWIEEINDWFLRQGGGDRVAKLSILLVTICVWLNVNMSPDDQFSNIIGVILSAAGTLAVTFGPEYFVNQFVKSVWTDYLLLSPDFHLSIENKIKKNSNEG